MLDSYDIEDQRWYARRTSAPVSTLRTMTETQTLDRTTVAKTEASAQSLMPEGILDALTPDQIRDLFGFLMRK